MYKHTQRSFAGGRLDAELMGRQDLAKYFQGASELKNFTVRRQGYISKRRGTDLAADLEHLLGHTTTTATEQGQETTSTEQNDVGRARLIPIVNEREDGFCVLMTAGRAFLMGRKGVRLMDGTWARSVADYELTDYADATVADDKRPFYVAVPYTDDEIADLNYTQSGDTIFLVHKSHAPRKLVFDGTKFGIEKIEFATQTWKRPRILSVTVKTGSDFGNGAISTISYVCTYVKDGIESVPSQPFVFNYQRPWGSKAALEIQCDKGENEEEPDYYNVYKKESTEYGLIATVGSPTAVIMDPEMDSGSEGQTSIIDQLDYYNHHTRTTSAIRRTQDLNYYLNNSGRDIVVAWPNYYADPFMSTDATLIGGVRSPGGLLLDFGGASGKRMTGFTLDLDAFKIYNYSWWEPGYDDVQRDGIYCYFSGTEFYATLTTSDLDGTNERTFTKLISVADIKGGLAPGENTIGRGYASYIRRTDNGAEYNSYKRMVKFDFSADLAAAYPSSGTAGAAEAQWQAVSLEIHAYSALGTNPTEENPLGTDPTEVDLYWHGLAFEDTTVNSSLIVDDFITPDLSLTPPSSEDHFDAAGDYPSAVAIHKQRLVFAATENDPFTFWLSQVGDLYNFSPHSSIREDDPISATTDATEFPQINHLIVNRDLIAFADSGEWRIAPSSGNALTYKTIAANMQSAIGSSKTLKPIAVGDEIVFADRTGQRLYATRYNWSSDGYESNDLSVLSQWIFKNNPIVAMAYRQHPDSTIECVLADGTMATLVYMKEHEVCAWSRAALGGGWLAKDIACTKAISNGSSEVLVLVERDGAFRLWRMRDDIPVRGGAVEAANQLCMDGARVLAVGETAAADETVVDCGTKLVAGYAFETTLVTVRPEVQGSNGTIQFELKNAKDAEVRVLDSGDFSCRATGVPAQLATRANADAAVSTQYGTVELKSGDYKLVLAGDSTGDGRVEVKSATVLPLNILSISVDYEIQPLSESEG